MQNLNKRFFIPVFDELNLGENEYCKKCNACYKTPLLPWIVGADYEKSEYKLMIIGKPHRGEGKRVSNNAFFMDYCIDWLMGCRWPYWSYSRQIAQNLYDLEGMNKIVLTNVVKCSNTDGKDTTTREMMDACIRKNGVIWREISLLKPKNILFYTYKLFPEYLKDIPFQVELLGEKREFVKCGAKAMPWWERLIMTEWGKVKFLVTCHPERMRKVEYIKLITDWVKSC